MPEPAAIRVRLIGLGETLKGLASIPPAVAEAQREGLTEGAAYLAGCTMENLSGRAGFPQWRSGRLARAVVSVPAQLEGGGFVARVGVLAVVPYARILEFGGYIPEHEVFAGALTGRSSKRVLSWPAGKIARKAFSMHLAARATPRQAQQRAGRATGWEGFAHATHVTIPGRMQRPIPYLGPTVDEGLPVVAARLRARIARALPGAAS